LKWLTINDSLSMKCWPSVLVSIRKVSCRSWRRSYS